MAKRLDLANQTFGYLTALSPTNRRDKDGNVYWLCRCNRCGNKTEAIARELKRGNRTSCGCAVGEVARNKNKTISDTLGGTNPNQHGMKTPNTNTTGFKGVSKYYRHGTFSGYRAYLNFKGKQLHGGIFKTIEEAQKRRKEMEEQYFEPITPAKKMLIKKNQDIQAVQNFYKLNGRPPMTKDFGNKSRAMINRNGTWNQLIVSAGLTPVKLKSKEPWTVEKLAEEARKVAVDGKLIMSEFTLRNNVKELFDGTWKEFLAYAGLEHRIRSEPNYLNKPFPQYSDDELIGHLKRRAEDFERTPGTLDILITNLYNKRFGNYTNALKLANLKPIADHDYLTREQLITKAQKDSHLGYISSSEFTHYYPAKREFGSWEEFKKQAGLLEKDTTMRRIIKAKNKSGFVYRVSSVNKKHLGTFKTLDEAKKVRDEDELKNK